MRTTDRFCEELKRNFQNRLNIDFVRIIFISREQGVNFYIAMCFDVARVRITRSHPLMYCVINLTACKCMHSSVKINTVFRRYKYNPYKVNIQPILKIPFQFFAETVCGSHAVIKLFLR